MVKEKAKVIADVKTKPLLVGLGLLGLLLFLFAFWVGIQAALTRHDPRVPVLLYHDFTTNDTVDESNKYLTPKKVFAAELAYLKNNGYQVVPLPQLIDYLDREPGADLPEKAVVITFDDGYAGNYFIGYPVLKQYQMPATIFLITSQIGNQSGELPRLTWAQMREMEASGLIDIQAHTNELHQLVPVDVSLEARPAVVSRAYLPAEQRIETRAEYEKRLLTDFILARETIAKNLNKEALTLAWPYGAYNLNALRLGRLAGFENFATLRIGMNQRGDSPLVIKRIDVEGDITLTQFAALLEPDCSFYRQVRQILARYANRLLEVYCD